MRCSNTRRAPRPALLLWLAVACGAMVGCVRPEFNKTPTSAEAAALTDVTQLTFEFDRAGEAYFSANMQWVIFQAIPRGEQHYQMYVAPVMYDVREKSLPPGSVARATPLPGLTVPEATDILRIGQPIRISPPNSRNTCGYFSPDGNSIVFASTAGKEDPAEPASGYQRQGGSYRWSFPDGMEIFRADGWQGAIAAAEPGTIVDLAKHSLTDHAGYDAEASYSPDGNWLCFTSNRSGDAELYAMRPDGSDVVRLTTSAGYDGGPFFSPDGRRLVYRSDRQKNDLLQIYVSDVVFDEAGRISGLTNERQLTHDDVPAERHVAATNGAVSGGDKASTAGTAPSSQPTSTKLHVNWGPYWHPDGKHIVYATSRYGGHTNYEIELMRDDGTLKTRITHSAGADVLPVISPDGRYMMWASRRSKDKTTQVFLARFHLPRGS